jgi:hypothetical protein
MASAVVAVLLHLLASGGWTIPGVAIHVWVLVAAVSSMPEAGRARKAGRRGWSLAVVTLGILLLGALRTVSLVPVQTAQLAISQFEFSQQRGQVRQATAALDRAVAADPWSPTATIWRADWLHWKLVSEGDSTELRRRWQSSLEMSQQRGGENPTLWEFVGRQQLHLYQRFGNESDLADADRAFTNVVQWDPADQQATAQLAAIAGARGDADRAGMLADRAVYLSKLGNNIERALDRQLIYVPESLGSAAAAKPIRAAASELLANHPR